MVTYSKSTHTDMLAKTGFVVLTNYKNTAMQENDESRNRKKLFVRFGKL